MKKITLCISVLFMLIGLSSMNAEEVVIGENDTIPAEVFAGGQGTAADPYQISDFRELLLFSTNMTADDISYMLTANIDASLSSAMLAGYPALGTFGGELNGNGFTISYLDIQSDVKVGSNLGFGFIAYSKTTTDVHDLHFNDLTVINKKAPRLGGIIGDMTLGGTVSRCSITGSSFITGLTHFGGITGYTKGSPTIEDCFVQAVIKFGTNTGKHFGGIIGSAGAIDVGGTISRCIFVGTANEPICKNTPSYATFEDCFCDTTNSTLLSNKTTFTGQTRITETLAKQQVTYTNFDFTNVWEIEEGVGYPTLRKPMYTVAFDCNPAYGTITGATSGKYAAGTDFTATATAEAGASFAGWYIDGIEVSTDAEYNYTNGMDDVTLYAHFTTNTSIQDLYYYNGFNSESEMVYHNTTPGTEGSKVILQDWGVFQGVNAKNTYTNGFVEVGDATYNKFSWNTDAWYTAAGDIADVQMEMSFQFEAEGVGLDFLLRSTTDRKTAINVELSTKDEGNDYLIVKLNTATTNFAKVALNSQLAVNTEYKFMVRLVDTKLYAWVAEVGSAYSDVPQLDYTIDGTESFQSSGIYGFGISEASTAMINYFAAGAPSAASIPTAMQETEKLELSIYPNPAQDFFTVATTDAVNVSVIDLSGKTVIASQMVSGTQNISITSLSSGLYFVKAGTELTKLIVE